MTNRLKRYSLVNEMKNSLQALVVSCQSLLDMFELEEEVSANKPVEQLPTPEVKCQKLALEVKCRKPTPEIKCQKPTLEVKCQKPTKPTLFCSEQYEQIKNFVNIFFAINDASCVKLRFAYQVYCRRCLKGELGDCKPATEREFKMIVSRHLSMNYDKGWNGFELHH